MIYIFLSISCSVTVSIMLKLARRYQINVMQAVLWNYLAAVMLSLLFFRPAPASLLTAPSLLQLVLGTLLPLLFLILASAVRHAGIVKTDIAQRLSLVIPLVAAVYLFGEHFTTFKATGLVIGLAAVCLIFLRKQTDVSRSSSYLYPLLVFTGFGAVDVLFKKLALDTTLPYTSSLTLIFAIAFAVTLLITVFQSIRSKQRFQLVNFACGMILGTFNFGNILFYMKAHRAFADNPSTVFAAMNMGVILAGSLIGIFLFKERMSLWNYAGIVLSLIAVLIITIAQHYAI